MRTVINKVNIIRKFMFLQLFFLVFILFIVSTCLMFYTYNFSPVWSAFFTSISAGCVTGIILLFITNAKIIERRILEKHFDLCNKMLHYERLFRTNQSYILHNIENMEINYLRDTLIETQNQAELFLLNYDILRMTCQKFYRNLLSVTGERFIDYENTCKQNLRLKDIIKMQKYINADEKEEVIMILHSIHCMQFEANIKLKSYLKSIGEAIEEIDNSLI